MKSDYGYTMTMKEFFEKGYKLEKGDLFVSGNIIPVCEFRVNDNKNYNNLHLEPDSANQNRYIKKSAQLEREDLHQHIRYGFPINWAAMPYGISYMVSTYISEIEADRKQYIKEFNSGTKMKPFNLERALAGDKVITRGGQEVTQITKFDAGLCVHCVVGVKDGVIGTYTIEGRSTAYRESRGDLFMAQKVVKYQKWINLYANGRAGVPHRTRDEAVVCAEDAEFKTHLIEWEVEK